MQTAYSDIIKDTYKLKYWNYFEEDTRKYGIYPCDKIIEQIISKFKRIHGIHDKKITTVKDLMDYYHNKVLLERARGINRRLLEQANKTMKTRKEIK